VTADVVAQAPATRAKPSWRKFLGGGLGIAVIVIVFGFVLPRLANYQEVWHQIRSMSGGWLVLLVVVELVNLITYAPSFMASLPGIGFRQSLELQFVGAALSNVAPLGGAVSIGFQYRMMREWDFSPSSSSRAMVVSGVWNQLCNVGLPVVGLTLVTLEGGRNAALILAAQIGAVLFVAILGAFLLILASDTGARAIGQVASTLANLVRRVAKRPARDTLPAAMVRFRHDSVTLVKRRWAMLTITTLAGVLTVFLVFLVCLRAVGIPSSQVTATEAFAAWSVTRLLTAIPLTPGGIGILDVGLAGALTGFGGNNAQVVATVLLYRVITFVPPVTLGTIAFFTWKRHPERHEPHRASS
jgi:uncharacterized protein (TIRG00374 family)